MRRAGLDRAIGDLVDIVYVDAPHLASGPIPNDVAPFFEGPYYEWWNAIQVNVDLHECCICVLYKEHGKKRVMSE